MHRTTLSTTRRTRTSSTRVALIGATIGLFAGAAAGTQPEGVTDLKRDGAFGFPQKDAAVLCDTPTLRVSAYSDGEHLYVQAILFTDGDDTVGEAPDGREIGDWSNLAVDADGDGAATGQVDRNYALNPWPKLPGLHYSVVFDDRGSSGLTADSKGRGAISYVPFGEGKARVDSYLIPLAEIGRKPGDAVRVAYWGSSATPTLVVNSVGFSREKPYYAHHLPRKDWHALTLTPRPEGPKIDVQAVPEGRGTIALEAKEPRTNPEVGSAPPEVAAGAWLNWKGTQPPTLAGLKGKVVVVEFWATWCQPCVAGIPHLNELHEKLAGQGLVILSLTDQKKEHVEEFMQARPMRYTVGVSSKTVEAYGVTGIPHAFIVGRDGKLLWHGHPAEDEFEAQLKKALGAN